VKKKKEIESELLDSIWGGLRSIDADKFVEDRKEVIRKYNEFNKKCMEEKESHKK